MKKILYFLYILVVIVILIPKKELYYTAEALLEKEEIYLSGETLSGGWFGLDIDNVRILSGISPLANVDHIQMTPWIVVNDLSLYSIKASDGFTLFFPGEIEQARFRYALWNPFEISVTIRGDFGNADGKIDLQEGKIILYVNAVPQMKNYPLLVSKLRSEEGVLVYEHTFK
ncbi:hypothetical protein [Sulfuricurvum sp.]|uniref:hypothetical protein n=1 Tax=Sulfuricurvum sp. TaxID=2025608 RepID=UPI0019866938|nr:hypothetical protein [Sulfuricurvum sp.]MBD3806457.1 hypothetical protein [Sulfuricurvum sp.]